MLSAQRFPLFERIVATSLHAVTTLADSSGQYSTRLFHLIPYRGCSRHSSGNRKGESCHTSTERLILATRSLRLANHLRPRNWPRATLRPAKFWICSQRSLYSMTSFREIAGKDGSRWLQRKSIESPSDNRWANADRFSVSFVDSAESSVYSSCTWSASNFGQVTRLKLDTSSREKYLEPGSD